MQFSPVNFMASDATVSLARSFRDVGFALLINHPINPKLIQECHLGWKKFFDSDEKYNFQYDKKSLDGYFPYGLENARIGKKRDLKEYYYFYAWGKCPEYLKQKTLELYNELTLLGTKLLQQAEDGLPAEIKAKLSMPLAQMVEKTPRAVLRILHYPPLEKNEFDIEEHAIEGGMRAIEHEDLTLLTIVTPLIGNGLQLRDLQGRWHDITAGFDALAINIGDMLQMCTHGFYQATTHRVINPHGEEAHHSRYSNAFFLNPRDEVQLDEEHTALSCLNEHINKKLEYYGTLSTDTAPSALSLGEPAR